MTEYKKGEIVRGRVTGIEKYGVFVSLDEYYNGLIHISQISDYFVKNINDYVSLGETVKAVILEVDEKELQVKLSLKDVEHVNNKRKREKIKETELGFSTLDSKLDMWINKKYEEIVEKKL